MEETKKIETPRGRFEFIKSTMEEMNEKSFYFHHSSDDYIYDIVSNGKCAYAILHSK